MPTLPVGKISQKVQKVFSSGKPAKESELASKLGAAVGAKNIDEALTAEQKADVVFNKLLWEQEKENAPKVYGADKETITKLAKENPNLGADELESKFLETVRPKPEVTTPEMAPYKGVATPTPVKVGDKEYPSTFQVENKRYPGTESLPEAPLTLREAVDRADQKRKGLTKTQKVGAAMAATGAVGSMFPNEPASTTPLVLSPSALGLEEEAQGRTDVEKEKAADKQPPPSLGGDVSKKPSTVESTTAAPPSQQKSVYQAAANVEELKEKLSSGQPINRADLVSVMESIQQVQPDPTKVDKSVMDRLQAAREDARTAYREQADRNQWMEVAQTLGNAVATFIAAQQGVANRPLTLPQIDYGARTGQALREYQTELASVSEQERAVEREKERSDIKAEREAEAKRRGWEKWLSLGEKEIEARERQAAQEKDLATRLELYKAREEKAYRDAAAKEEKNKAIAVRQGRKDYLAELGKEYSLIERQSNELRRNLAAAQGLVNADPKDFDKAFDQYVVSLSTSEKPVTKETFTKPGLLWGTNFSKEDAKKDAAARVVQLTQRARELKARQDANLSTQQDLIIGKAPAPAAAAAPSAQPPRQEPAAGGKVVMLVNGQRVQIDANKKDAFLAKYPTAVEE